MTSKRKLAALVALSLFLLALWITEDPRCGTADEFTPACTD